MFNNNDNEKEEFQQQISLPDRTSESDRYLVGNGWVFWFDLLKETKIGVSPLIVVLSNSFHNNFADHLVVSVVISKNIEKVRPYLEVFCVLENIPLKVLVSCIHTINKSVFFQKAKFLGRLENKTMREIGEKIKLILDIK